MALETGFVRPTLPELIARVQADLSTRLPGEDASIRRGVLWVLARVVAGAVHLSHGFAAWIARQILVDTADADVLDRHGAIWGIERTAPTYAAGNVTMTGVPATVCPAGTEIARTADGVAYTLDANATIAGGGSVDAAVTASVAGEDGNADVGALCELTSPLAGIDTACVVAAGGLTGGADEETDTAYRARILARIRETPQGGAEADYEAWALEVGGVERATVYPLENGAGTVTVRVLAEVPDGGSSADLVPGAPLIASVLAHLEDERPVTAIVDVPTLSPEAVDVTISVYPDTPTIRAAVEAELDAAIIRDAEPGGTIYLSRLSEAASRASGEEYRAITVPAADYTVATLDDVPILGVVTWV